MASFIPAITILITFNLILSSSSATLQSALQPNRLPTKSSSFDENEMMDVAENVVFRPYFHHHVASHPGLHHKGTKPPQDVSGAHISHTTPLGPAFGPTYNSFGVDSKPQGTLNRQDFVYGNIGVEPNFNSLGAQLAPNGQYYAYGDKNPIYSYYGSKVPDYYGVKNKPTAFNQKVPTKYFEPDASYSNPYYSLSSPGNPAYQWANQQLRPNPLHSSNCNHEHIQPSNSHSYIGGAKPKPAYQQSDANLDAYYNDYVQKVIYYYNNYYNHHPTA